MPSRDEIRSLSTKRRWIPPSTIRRDALTQESRNDLIFRKVRGILNKLTPEKFAKLSNDLLNVELNSDVILKGVILLIFDKALDEPKYSSMYAQLCKRLSDEAPNFEPQKPNVEGQKPQSTFRLLLLNKCKAEFENRSKANQAFDDQDDLAPEEEERRQLAKRKMLGNIKFIGELGKLEIVSETILHRCIQQLLLEKRRAGSRGDMAEDIECLCQIMRTCGRILDSDKGLKLMNQYFERMSVLAVSSDLPLRIRFMLRDCIELRRDGWKPRKATSTEGPMPINQIRNDNDDSSRGGGYNRRDERPSSDIFRKPRGGLDDMMGNISLSSPSFGMGSSSFSLNGYSGSAGVGYGRHNQRNQPNYYQNQNRHQNNYQGKHNHNQQQNSPQNYNNNGNKDQLRFKSSKVPLIRNSEEVSLRPAANSMVFSANMKPQNLPLSNRHASETLLSPAASLKASPPLLHKDPPPTILIKQGPVEKRDKARDRKDKGPSKEEVLKKANAIMDDLVNNGNVQDAITAIKDLKTPESFLRHVVYTFYSNTLDRGDAERELACKLVFELKKETLINGQQIIEGWKELVASMDERESTIACVASHVAFLTAKSIVDNLMQLTDLAPVTENGQHHPLFLLTLQQLHKTQGKARLMQIFNESKVNLMSQLPEAEKTKERLGKILEDRELTFLYPLLRIQREMWKQLEADPSPNALYKWIKEKLDPSHHSDPSFINALITVLLKYITQETTLRPGVDPEAPVDKALAEEEQALLMKYTRVLESFLPNIDSEVTALHALQVFCYSHKFPKGMLLRWFRALYEIEVISEEGFMKWKEDVTDDYPGKGQALFQVNSWLTWLQDASSEEEEDDGDN